MRIDRSQLDEAILDSVYLTNKRNEKYLSREDFIFLTRRGEKHPLDWLIILLLLAQFSFLVFLFTKMTLNEWNDYVLLTTEGETTLGILIEKEATRARSNYVYDFTYLYTVGNQSYFLPMRVDQIEFENTPEGSTRSIIYVPSEPDLATFDTKDDLWRFVMPRNILIAIVVFYLLYFAYIIFAKVRLIPAQIVAIEPYTHRILFWESHLLELHYEFVSPKTRQVISGIKRVPANNPPIIGQNLALIYQGDHKTIIL